MIRLLLFIRRQADRLYLIKSDNALAKEILKEYYNMMLAAANQQTNKCIV